MGAPVTKITEYDLSIHVPSFPGVYGGIVIPGAAKGEINKPYLCTNDTQFLQQFTPNKTIRVGYDLAYYSALAYLQKADKLWVVRAANTTGLYYAGAEFKESTGTNITAAAGITNPDNYTFGNGAGNRGLLLLHGSSQGTWANNIGIKLFTKAASPSKVKAPASVTDAFLIEVYDSEISTVNPVEVFTCSFNPNAKDGYGRNMFVEDRVKSSSYIRAVENTALTQAGTPVRTLKEQTSILYFTKGANGGTITASEMMTAADSLINPDDVPLTLLMDGGYPDAQYKQYLAMNIAEVRQDCLAVLSTLFADEDNTDYITQLLAFRNTTLNVNSSYATLVTPHVWIRDKFNHRDLYVAPDGYLAAAISETASDYAMWYPAAGFRRGRLNVSDVRRRFTMGEMDTLYDAGINPIRFAPGRGIVLWGQKTLYGLPSALDRTNVRCLLIEIEPRIKKALDGFLFELNDESTRMLIRAMLDTSLASVKARRGLMDYRIVCDDSNNLADDIENYRLNVDIYIKPPYAIEYIMANIVITRAGLDFKLAQMAMRAS